MNIFALLPEGATAFEKVIAKVFGLYRLQGVHPAVVGGVLERGHRGDVGVRVTLAVSQSLADA